MICIPIRIQLHLILQKEKTTLHQNRTTTFYWLGSVLPSKLLLLVFALILDLWQPYLWLCFLTSPLTTTDSTALTYLGLPNRNY